MDWSEIIIGVIGLIGALIAGGLTLKFVTKRNSKVNIVSQKNNDAGGDIVAGNKITNNK